MTATNDSRPLIAHVVYRFDVGGLENGVANLVNRLPAARFRHAVIALTEVTDFRRRIQRADVEFVALGKGAGHGIKLAPQLYRLFRRLRPSIVHTRNLAALEATLPAALARVPVRLHGEHGWDVSDPGGENRKNRLIRRLYRPFVTHYVALSADLERYLRQRVGVPAARVSQIYNGVDTARFVPPPVRSAIEGCPFAGGDWLVGTVGRLAAVKNQAALVRAVARACAQDSEAAARMRLVIVGDGPQRGEVEDALRASGVADRVWLAGARDDVAAILRGLDCFVLPSIAEGVSNTILEAMASGLPVVATGVGGNPELIDEGVSGRLVPAGDDDALAAVLLDCMRDGPRAQRLGRAARLTVERRFSLDRMAADYAGLYERLLARRVAAADGLRPAGSA